MRKIKQGTAFNFSIFLVEAADHVTPVTGHGAIREQMDLAVHTVNLDAVFELKVPGDTAYTFGLVNNATLTIITQDATSINIGYQPGVSTQDDLCDLIEASATHVQVADRGANGATLIDNPDDHVAGEAFTGGADNAAGVNMISLFARWDDGQWINVVDVIQIGEASVAPLSGTAIGAPAGDFVGYVEAAFTSGRTGELSFWATAGDGGETFVAASDPAIVRVQIVAYDPEDSVRMGMTALPNANAEAAGGLYTRGTGAGQINQDANGRIDTNAVAWNELATVDLPLAPTEVGRKLDVTAAGNAGIDWGNIQSPTTVVNLTGTTIKDVTDVNTDTDELLLRLTALRAGYLDNLNIGGLVASSTQVTAIQNNTRVVITVPEVIERPDAGTQVYRIELFLYDEVGNMEAPDAAPTIELENQAGVDRSSRLDSTTMTNIDVGHYRAEYTAAAADTLEQLVWRFIVTEGTGDRTYGRGSLIVDTTAVDFTSADRTKLDSIDARLPATLSGGRMRSQVEGVDAAAIVDSSLATSAITKITNGLLNTVLETITIAPHDITPYDITFARAVRGLFRYTFSKFVDFKTASPALRDLNDTKDVATGAVGVDRVPTVLDLD